MTAFFETPRFPDNIAFWADGGAGYKTSIVVLNSGFEQRNVNWAQSRGRWEVSNGLRERKDVEQAIAFFRAVKGRAYGFRFKDWNDYQDAGNGLFNTVTTSPIIFQMVKVYIPTGAAVGNTDTRTIRKPVAATFKMYRLGVLITAGGGLNQYAFDPTTGLLTMTVGSDNDASHYTWTGEFDVPVRFDTDEMRGRVEPQGGFYEWNPIPVVEIRT